jgi:hypothetical protein
MVDFIFFRQKSFWSAPAVGPAKNRTRTAEGHSKFHQMAENECAGPNRIVQEIGREIENRQAEANNRS